MIMIVSYGTESAIGKHAFAHSPGRDRAAKAPLSRLAPQELRDCVLTEQSVLALMTCEGAK